MTTTIIVVAAYLVLEFGLGFLAGKHYGEWKAEKEQFGRYLAERSDVICNLTTSGEETEEEA